VNSIRRNNTELCEVRIELERRLAHLVAEERQVLMLVLNEYLYLFCKDIEGVLPCTTKGSHEIRTGTPYLSRRFRTEYRMRYERR
jgi:hypothetical protein